MHLSNVSNWFKKLLFLQQIEIRFSVITFMLKIRLCNWCERHHLIELFSYFIYSLLKHAVQRIYFKTFVCNSRSRRQSSQAHLIFQIIRNFDDELRRKCFLLAFMNALSKTFYNIDLKILLFKLEIIFNKIFFCHNYNSFCRSLNHYSFHSQFVKINEWYHCDDLRYWIDFVVLYVFSHFQRDCRVFCAS